MAFAAAAASSPRLPPLPVLWPDLSIGHLRLHLCDEQCPPLHLSPTEEQLCQRQCGHLSKGPLGLQTKHCLRWTVEQKPLPHAAGAGICRFCVVVIGTADEARAMTGRVPLLSAKPLERDAALADAGRAGRAIRAPRVEAQRALLVERLSEVAPHPWIEVRPDPADPNHDLHGSGEDHHTSDDEVEVVRTQPPPPVADA